ncbi:MAG: transporter [Proteobacteria bacterium]|nr:transporter [Pseudomonadota bacterium]
MTTRSRRGPNRRSAARLLAIAAAALVLSAGTRADEPKPDKSGYSIFNPTPTDLMRDFNTDRPTKANVPWTVDAGHYLMETDVAVYGYTHGKSPPINQRNWLVLDPTFKVGLTDRVEFDLLLTGLYSNTQTHDRTTGVTRTLDGFGDTTLRTKINLWGNEGGASALTVIPLLKLPTNSGGLGNNAVEGGVISSLAIAAPYDVTIFVAPEFDALRNAGDNGRHGHYSQLINVNRLIAEKLTAYVEFYADEGTDRRERNFYTVDVAVSWIFLPGLQLDVGANIGVSDAAPALQAYFGFAARF